MTNSTEFPAFITRISLEKILRIDLGLEGDWSNTVVTVWSRYQGRLGFSKAFISHPNYKPSLELYFSDFWLGVHCFSHKDGMYLFDEVFATKLIEYVEDRYIKI
jgi:hypothetical protein